MTQFAGPGVSVCISMRVMAIHSQVTLFVLLLAYDSGLNVQPCWWMMVIISQGGTKLITGKCENSRNPGQECTKARPFQGLPRTPTHLL